MTISRVALDLDDTLASRISPASLEKIHISWFRKNNLIVQVENEFYILHPGAIELIRYLHQKPYLSFCFFSHGMFSRNRLLVTFLLKRALCDKDYKYAMTSEEFEEFMKKMEKNIFSKRDCSPSIGGGYHKDLKIVLEPENNLDFTILLDDQISSVSHGQKANGLLISYADDRLFQVTFSKNAFRTQQVANDDLRSANHLFFAVYLLEIIFSNPEKTPAEALFEIQYQEDGIERFWLTKYSIALVSYPNKDSLNISLLQSISSLHDNVPVLIRLVNSNEIMIFGKPNGVDYAFTQLDPKFLKKIHFPRIDQPSFLLENDSEILCLLTDEIKAKKGHIEKNYEVNYDLRDNNIFYLNGFKLLQSFATTDLNFYGFEANPFFGLHKEESQTIEQANLVQVESSTVVARFTQPIKSLYTSISSAVFKTSESKTGSIVAPKPVALPNNDKSKKYAKSQSISVYRN